MIKKDIVLSKKEISLVSGGFDVKKFGKKVQETYQDTKKFVQDTVHDFQAGRKEAKKEAEAKKTESQPSAPADDNAKHEV